MQTLQSLFSQTTVPVQCFPVGMTTNTFVCTDPSGNTATCSLKYSNGRGRPTSNLPKP
ncbi:MAG: HYR domain-containing protein [Lewinellaceae bacterium]|nr:HYR domain-containing protein [Lewinellaceae bacterium]